MMLFPFALNAQVYFTPYVGLSSTRLTESYSGYAKGGNFPVIGVEVEVKRKSRSYSPFNISLASGISYLNNGFHRTSSFPLGTTGYSYESTNIETKYWQLPLTIRLNWRPFPLVEDWRVFFGAGICYNYLTYAQINEDASGVNFIVPSALWPPPTSYSYNSSFNATDAALKNSLFKRFELGMKFKHIQVTWRLSLSTQDMYFKGYEKTWQGPAYESFYINSHNSRGITRQKYSEIIFGWRF